MFTGIIEEVGLVKNARRSGGLFKLSVQAKKVLEDLRIGDSVSVNGACLTATDIKDGILFFDVVQETFKLTNLQYLHYHNPVNLERALKMGDRISGHFVTGHIDCLGILRKKIIKSGNITLEIAIPVKFVRFIITKGSICINGVSLTVVSVKSASFTVSIIPHTWQVTNLAQAKIGDKLNIETDILLKKAS